MNLIKLFKYTPLGSIPQVSDRVNGTRFEHLSLEEIRGNEDDFYEFIRFVIEKVNQ